MSEKYQNDLMHLQNDILIDLKNVETKIDTKIKKLNKSLEQKWDELESKLNYLENAYTVLLQRTQSIKITNNANEKEEMILSKIESLNKKFEEQFSNLDNKYYHLNTELKDFSFKFEKILNENFNIPGLIGYKAPFSSFKIFIENIHKKLNETIKTKDHNASEFKKYAEKLDRTININKNNFSMLENKINADFKGSIKSLEKKYDNKINTVEEKINVTDIENKKNYFDLVNQCNGLNDKFNLINNSLSNTSDEIENYKNKFKEINDKLEENYKSFEEKSKIINEEFDKINKNNINITNLEKKINELENLYLTTKGENILSSFEEVKSKSKSPDNFENIELSKSNNVELNNEEDDKNSIFSNRLNKIFENNTTNSNNIKFEKKTSSARNYFKKNDLYDSKEKEEHEAKNNKIYESGNLKQPKNLKSILYSPNMNSKTRELHNRIISGKIFNKFPFISYYRKENNEDIQLSLSRNKLDSVNKDRIISNENSINKKGEEKDIGELTLNFRNLKKKQNEKAAKEKNNLSIHRYNYLEKKIDILGRVMIENLNKIIMHIQFLKTNNNNSNPFFKIKKIKDSGILEENYNFKSISKGKKYISSDLKKSDTFYKKEDLNYFLDSKINKSVKFFKKENKKVIKFSE